ncbi:MAG TPA: hypothetical protein VKC60_17720, partial [Opitutaceae bacterium]|nr:hypothetical protein [Opitutaceae bacterium]
RPTLGDLGFVAIAGGLFLVLGGYAFIGSLSLHSDILNKDQAGPPGSGLATIVSTIETSFPKTLQSISDHADTLSDFQLGYGLIALLVMAIIGAVYRRRVVFWIPIGVIGFLVLLLTPVPWLNAFLWGHIPYSLFTLTNVWPMQRLYLLLAGWIIFAVAAIWPKIQIETLPWKHIARILIVAVAAVIWSSVEAWQFIHRGYGTQRDEVTSVRSHWPEYINLTPTAYSMLGIPATYTDGPVEVEHEFRLVRRDDYFPLIDNWQVKSEKPPAAQGRITVKTKIGNALILEPKINLAPGRRYLLTFQFLVPSVTGGLLFRDDVATRSYGLSTSARWRGFGMNPDNRHSLVVWTSAKTETPLEMILSLNEPLQTEWTDFADFTLEEIDRNQLPIKTQLLVPELHCEINSPEAAWLVTPRIHVKGYKASVDGIQARVINSDDGEILIAVPKGKHRVELRYTGFALLNIAFYSCLVGWCCVGSVAFLLAIRGERVIEAAQLAVKRTAVLLWTRAVWIGASAIVITVVFVSWRAWQQHRDAVGPVSMEVWLPMKKDGQTEPLLAVGKSGSGAIVFINYVDTTHIKLGMNVWGGDYVTTEPIEVDFGRPHRFVVTMGALYPQANPHLSGWNGQQLEWFRSKFKLTIDENVALLKTIPSKESSFKDITVGENLIGASVATTEFSGQIISSSRLPLDLAGCPFPSAEQLAKTIGPLQLTARLPTDKLTRVEPLLTTGVAGKGTFVFVNYMDAAHIRIGVDVWNVSLKWSDPIEIDYAKPQVFAISSSALYPPSHSGLKDLSAAQLDHLRNTIDVYHNGKKVFTQPTSAYDSTPEQTNIGVTRIGGSNTDPAFTGEFLDVRRLSIPRISENAISSK